MEPEVHIAGVVVFTLPDASDRIKSRISSLPAAEVHATSADGKLIITLETDGTKRTIAYMDAIRALPGVLEVALVYQHAESLKAIEQEVQT